LFEKENYQFKKSTNSLHQYVINHMIANPEMRTLELGANRGILSSYIAPKVKQHVAVDQFQPDLAGDSDSIALDLDGNFSSHFELKSFDSCVALDVIEHLNSPEKFLSETSLLLRPKSKLYISTANICYLPMRLSLLLGQFNYGKRGILDLTHKRLFSVSSFRRLLRQYGFRIEKVIGFPPPVADLVSDQGLFKFVERIHAWFSRHFPNLFAYNFLVVCTRLDDISDIFNETLTGTTTPTG
jgi:2-polyprenyl-3-methyl-5-hydroxy-6-metoxy-1,4-benzoquinol methylase